ncbi:hypothetical protein ACFSMW_07080 [Virgibacillus halophilus]|uniref:DUF1189 domain-containing protein n=1 Tax=Tigheibacillus halophilus TaxID=361280 RepID=A0ABU5C6L2_9BACI|nr:hypothetical protein [Virgibacillus halophilus]
MTLWKIWTDSLRLPNKQAMFRLNRTGMDMMLIYMLLLLAIVSIPAFIGVRADPFEKMAQIHLAFQLVYFLIFSYLPLVIIICLLLSGIAYAATGICKLLHRKVKYSLLWKLTAATTTIPFLLYTIIALTYPINEKWLWLFIPISLLFMIKNITVFPKRRNKATAAK